MAVESLVLDGLQLNGGTVSTGFDAPDDLAGLEVWMRPETLGANGTAISPWANDGSGADALQATAGKKPLVAASVLDGKSVARFDGTDDEMQISGLAADATRTIFVVAKQAASTDARRVVDFGGSVGGIGNRTGQWGYYLNQAGAQVQFGTDPAAGFAVVAVKWTGTGSADGYVNGGSATNFDPHDGYSTATILNVASFGGGAYWNGDVAEVIVYDSALSDADRLKVLGYLSAKYPSLGSFGTAPASAPELTLTDLKFTPAKRRPEWAEPDDGDGALLVRDPRFTNSQWDLTVEVRGASRDAGHVGVGAITDKLVEASKKPLGIPLVHTPADSSDSTTWYVLMGEVNEIPVTWESGYFSTPPVLAVNLTLTSRPFGYEAEVTVSAAAGSGPLQIVSLPNVTGDAAAEARLVITDTATQSRDFAAWGLEWLYQAGADLLLTQPDLTATGFAGTSTTRAGSVSTNIFRGTLTTSPVAVCGTGNQPHIGVFRPYLRCYPTSTGIRVRFTYREGDGPLKSLEWETPVAANDWNELDLGVITIPEKLLGTQRWIGQIEAYSSTPGDTLDVDYLALVPAGTFGRARRPAKFETSTTFSVRDEFDQSAGALTGKAAPVGGTWTVVTGSSTSDFQVEATGHTAQQTGASAGSLPRLVTVGTTNYTAIVVQTDLMFSALPVAQSLSQGVIARADGTSVNNALRAHLNVAATGAVKIRVTTLGTTHDDQVGIPTPQANAWYTLRLLVDAAGRFAVWFVPRGTTSAAPVAVGQQSLYATGGARATGRIGLMDFSEASITRSYDNFMAFVPAANAVCFSGQSIEFRSDDTQREDSTGTYWGDVPEYRGAPFFLPPAGDENRTSRVAVMLRRNDIYTMPEANVTDNQSVEVRYTPRRLYLPR